MKRLPWIAAHVLFVIVLAACTATAQPTAPPLPTTTSAAPTPTIAPPATLEPTNTAAPEPTEAPTEAPTGAPSPTTAPLDPDEPGEGENPEAILIRTPGNSSRVTSPVRVAGEADSTFEQALTVRIVTVDGETLATQPATIAAELGQRGPYEAEVAFTVDEETQAWIQVFATSARDGGITHLSAVGLLLAPDGEEDIVAGQPHEERISIESPTVGETLSGGEVVVRGRGLASFEQTLIVELLDEEGRLITMTPLIVDAPDLGEWGEFEATLSYEVSERAPARVVVYDPSPAFGGEVHLASVEVWLE